MLFGKKKKDQTKRPSTIREAMAEEPEDPVEFTEAEAGQNDDAVVANDDVSAEEKITSEATEAAEPGALPQDFSEISSKKGYVDFGALLVPAAKDQKVRLDIDQKSKRVVSLTIAIGSSSIQLQAFSAPKSGGIWQDVRQQIEDSVVKQKGRVKQVEGPFGRELHARVPTVLKDGRKGWRAARFIGFEGRRWFLRGVIGGRGAIDREAAQGVEELFSKLVVVRGDDPLPPRELLKLSPPAGAKRVVTQRQNAQGQASGAGRQPSQPAQRPQAAGANRTNGVPPQAQKPDQQ
ncbi:MAG: DUF3710 domain-containing protein [Nesterenkonia sp.]